VFDHENAEKLNLVNMVWRVANELGIFFRSRVLFISMLTRGVNLGDFDNRGTRPW